MEHKTSQDANRAKNLKKVSIALFWISQFDYDFDNLCLGFGHILKGVALVFAILAVWLLFAGIMAPAETLDELYGAALANTSTIKERKFNEAIAREQKDQVVAEVLPTLSATSTSLWRDQADVGAFGEGYQHNSYLTLSQPLFQGGGEYFALGVARNLPRIAQLQTQQTQIELYTEIAQAFYELLKLKREEENLTEQSQTLAQRVRTLAQRARIGRSKQTDVLAARSQAARITAELAALGSRLVLARQRIRTLTGLDKFGEPVDNGGVEALEVPDQWEVDLLQTPRVQALRLAIENSNKEISAARAAFLPSVDLDANYYLDRAGILSESDWDVTLNAKWNIFSGGNDSSQVRIEILQTRGLEAQLIDLERNTKTEFEALKREFVASKDVIEKLKTAVDLARSNYKQHMREANQGLVSNLDVLRVLEEYLQVKRAYDQQVYDTKIAWVRLRGLAGVLP